MPNDQKIFVAGHRGLAGSAIVEALKEAEYTNIITRTRSELDLQNSEAVTDFMQSEKPDTVVLAAAKVGGIHANNTYSAQFIYENLQIQNNVIHQAHCADVRKLLFLGSSCIYPKYAPQPLKEEYLLSGHLEPTNEAYAVAKIAGIEMCRAYRKQYGRDYISAMPTNLYGPRDNFHLENAHVLPAMIHKFHIAKTEGHDAVPLWGSGKPYREFLYSLDLGRACVFLLEHYSGDRIVNIGTGNDVSIRELAETIQRTIGFTGRIDWDSSKPDGTPRKLLDVSKIKELGWQASTPLETGIQSSYQWFLDHQGELRQK
jgi:GDP-L-fucose synthase